MKLMLIQITIYYKEYRPDLGEYPMPDYIAAVPYLEADAEISNFTIQNIRNGLTTATLYRSIMVNRLTRR